MIRRKPQRVGAERLDHLERINGVAQGFAHLAAGVVAHGAVENDVW